MSTPASDPTASAGRVVARLRARGATVAAAESLTGGLLCDALVCVPGASRVLGGGVVAYTAAAKRDVLGVPAPVLDQHGTVSPVTAEAMAHRARALFGTDWGVATTGVAGPEPSEGHPVGTVYVALVGEELALVRALTLRGSRPRIRIEAVGHALALVEEALAAQDDA